jgi:hypothetical protein
MVTCCLGRKDTQVVELPIVDSLSPRPPYLPLAVPKDLASRLARLHGDPIVWWIGQFLRFILRPQEATSNMIQEASVRRGFKRPIVGWVNARWSYSINRINIWKMWHWLNITRMIKSRAVRWMEHVVLAGEKKNTYMVLVGKHEGRSCRRYRHNGRIRLKWIIKK